MARSLGLTAYRALTRRGDAPKAPARAPRPEGELAWLHAGEPQNGAALIDLAARLMAQRDGLRVLLSHPAGTSIAQHPESDILTDPLPGEHPGSVAGFLDHWQPDVCLWTWGGLRPNLLLETNARGCPMLLIDADSDGFDGRRDRWLPDLTGRMLSQFSHVLTRSDAGRRRLRQLGLTHDKARLTTRLMAGGQALACVESDLADLSQALGGRPVWFAVWTQPEEISTILRAHRQAMRLSHRLLLILNPATPAQAQATADLAAEAGFNVLGWGDGSQPDESTQVMIADDTQDRGLFFRVAPVSFLGSSLVAQDTGCDPFEAAALGSAVLYGPKVRRFLPSYNRLAAAGAARIVNDATALGTAVSRLIAPDQAATMAHAGWDVISQGAELTDQITELVQEALDTRARAR